MLSKSIFILLTLFVTIQAFSLSEVTPGCRFCQDIVKVIDRSIHEANVTFMEVERFVEYLCHVINPIVAPECDIVLKDINQIFNWIVNGTYPTNEICSKLGLC